MSTETPKTTRTVALASRGRRPGGGSRCRGRRSSRRASAPRRSCRSLSAVEIQGYARALDALCRAEYHAAAIKGMATLATTFEALAAKALASGPDEAKA
jgi:hypothetical protein